jgi:hypothetical protein
MSIFLHEILKMKRDKYNYVSESKFQSQELILSKK